MLSGGVELPVKLVGISLAVQSGIFPAQIEWNLGFRRLILVKIKTNRQRFTPALAKGQLWRTKDSHVQIVDMGKRLIHYRLLKDLRQMRRTQTTVLETLEEYLKSHGAELVKENSRN